MAFVHLLGEDLSSISKKKLCSQMSKKHTHTKEKHKILIHLSSYISSLVLYDFILMTWLLI